MSVEKVQTPDETIWVLKPNKSADWRFLVLFMCASGGLTLTIATIWAILGAWMILPFAGLEVLVLFYVIWRVAKITHCQQTIHFKTNHVQVQYGLYYPRETWQLDSTRAKFYLLSEPTHNQPHIELNDGKHRVSIGGFLNSMDKKILVDWIESDPPIPRVKGKQIATLV